MFPWLVVLVLLGIIGGLFGFVYPAEPVLAASGRALLYGILGVLSVIVLVTAFLRTRPGS